MANIKQHAIGIATSLILSSTIAPSVQAASFISAFYIGEDDPSELQSTFDTAEISEANSTSSARVQTLLGTNKIDLNAGSESNAISVWNEHFIVDPNAVGPVKLSFGVRIDGTTSANLLDFEGNSGPSSDVEFNYYFHAIRGVSGAFEAGIEDGDMDELSFRQQFTNPTNGFLNERTLWLDSSHEAVSTITQPSGVVTYSAAPFEGPFGEGVLFQTGSTEAVYYTDRLVVDFTPGGSFTVLYSDGTVMANTAKAFYDSLTANDPYLASTTLCGTLADSCGPLNLSGGTNLLLNFTLNPGEEFNIVGALMANDIASGSVNFFNTAQLYQITSSAGLFSDSGQLNLPGAGTLTRSTTGFSFAPASAAVPEPATWAMLIGGFGMVGGAMRCRRQSSAARAASQLRPS